MAQGTPIKDSIHLTTVNGTEKIPVSDGSGKPKHATVGDLRPTPLVSVYTEEVTDEYVNLEFGVQHKDSNGKNISSSYAQYKLEPASDSTAGLMSAADKKKLNELNEGGKLIPVTYSELKALRDNAQLTKGAQYRITDYECKVNPDATDYRSANNIFDIIVIADSNNTLNEEARAIKHENDTYFQYCDLNGWELKYSIDNDSKRFFWCDVENGKGVIYFMRDDANNEAWYDFKNIQFKVYKVKSCDATSLVGKYVCTTDFSSVIRVDMDSFDWYYTFSFDYEWYGYKDSSSYTYYGKRPVTNNKIHKDSWYIVLYSAYNPSGCNYNTINGKKITLLNAEYNVIDNSEYIVIGELSNRSYFINCTAIVLGNNSSENTFLYSKHSALRDRCNYNTLNYAQYKTLYDGCNFNRLSEIGLCYLKEESSYNNISGTNVVLSKSCSNVTIPHSCGNITFNHDYVRNVTLENDVANIRLISKAPTSSSSVLKNILIKSGVSGSVGAVKDIRVQPNQPFLTTISNEDDVLLDPDGNELGFTSIYKQKVDDMYTQLEGLGDLLNEVANNINSL